MRWQGRAKGGTGAAVEEGGHRFNPNGPPTRADVFRQAGAEPAGSDAGRPSGWPVLGRGPPPGETLAPAGVVQAVAAVREKLKGRRQDHRHGGTGGGAILQVLAGHFRAGPCRGLHLRDMMVRVRRRRRGGRAQSRPRHEGKGEQGRKAELEEFGSGSCEEDISLVPRQTEVSRKRQAWAGLQHLPRQGARGLCRAGTAEAPPPSRMDGRAPWNPLRAMIFSARTFPTCFGPTGCRESRSPPGGSSLPWGRCKPSTLPLGLVSPAAKRLSSRTFSE